MQEEFYRIKRLPPYVFAEVNKMKADARANGDDIIDFGMETQILRRRSILSTSWLNRPAIRRRTAIRTVAAFQD